MNPDNLPYDYTVNNRDGHPFVHMLAGVSSVVMLALNFFGWTNIPSWLVTLPAIVMVLRWFLYTLLTNAFHEALRNAERDSYLDEIVTAEAEARDVEERKGALDPGFFNDKLLQKAPQ